MALPLLLGLEKQIQPKVQLRGCEQVGWGRAHAAAKGPLLEGPGGLDVPLETLFTLPLQQRSWGSSLLNV